MYPVTKPSVSPKKAKETTIGTKAENLKKIKGSLGLVHYAMVFPLAIRSDKTGKEETDVFVSKKATHRRCYLVEADKGVCGDKDVSCQICDADFTPLVGKVAYVENKLVRLQ